jgi:hypothetical protein
MIEGLKKPSSGTIKVLDIDVVKHPDKVKELIAETVQNEMAIANYQTVGDFNKRSSISSKVDRDLVTHPKAIKKIKRQWEKTPWDFDIFVINDPRVNKSKFREVGVVDPSFVYNEMKLTPQEISLNPDHITILFTNNVAAEKIPLTGWTMAHRLGHAMSASRNDPVGEAWREFTAELRKIFNEIMRDVYGIETAPRGQFDFSQDYEKKLKYVAQELGTMKAARDKKLRSWFEFAYELLAQYFITGHIKLNPLPDRIVVGMGGWARPQYAYAKDKEAQTTYNNHDLEYFAHNLESWIDNVLNYAVGKVFVM